MKNTTLKISNLQIWAKLNRASLPALTMLLLGSCGVQQVADYAQPKHYSLPGEVHRDTLNRMDGIPPMDLEYQGFSAGSPVTDLAVGDLNADGINDIVASHYERHEISVWLSDGKGNFTKTSGDQVSFPQNLVIGDFDEDKKNDFAVISQDGYVLLYTGRGDGRFSDSARIDLDPGTIGLRSGDLNADGHLDLVVPNYILGTMSVLLGRGNGTFEDRLKSEIGTNTYYLQILDLDRDGDQDIASVSHDAEAVEILRNDGRANFEVRRFAAGATPLGISTGDLDNDGLLDIIVTGQLTGEVRILRGQGNLEFSEAALLAQIEGTPMPLGTFLMKFDENSSLDLVVANYEQGKIQIFTGREDRSLNSTSLDIELRSNPQVIVQIDVNGDQLKDLAAGLRPEDGVELILRHASTKHQLYISAPSNGVIRSQDGRINCSLESAACSFDYPYGAEVRLEASPLTADYRFLQWHGTGECLGSSNPVCVVSITERRWQSAMFEHVPIYMLNISMPFNGSIKSDDGKIDCSMGSATMCTAFYNAGTRVRLTASSSDPNYRFVQWNGVGQCFASNNPVCELTMDASKFQYALFERVPLYTLIVTAPVNGSIRSEDGNIDCSLTSSRCSATYTAGSRVRLLAVPGDENYVFSSWLGAGECLASRNPVCEITMDSNKFEHAMFDRVQIYSLIVIAPASGVIRSSDGRIECSREALRCSASYNSGTRVTLTATSTDENFQFMQWSGVGECLGSTNPVCEITMDGNKWQNAMFQYVPLFTVNVSIPVHGSIQSADGKIDCSSATQRCAANYPMGSNVSLIAVPSSENYRFVRWIGSGECFASTNPRCELVVDGNKWQHAMFEEIPRVAALNQ